jgi:hypothetical protein
LSNKELITHCSNQLDSAEGLDYLWQVELLNRFIALAPLDEFPPKDERQLDLFLTT